MAARTSSTTTTSYKPRIRHIAGTRYDVQSRTRPDHIHHVDTYRLTCTCEAGSFGKRCWAMAAALQFEAWRKHELAKAEPQRGYPAARPSGPSGRAEASVSERSEGARSGGMAALQDAF
jgi:hypothetical protein